MAVSQGNVGFDVSVALCQSLRMVDPSSESFREHGPYAVRVGADHAPEPSIADRAPIEADFIPSSHAPVALHGAALDAALAHARGAERTSNERGDRTAWPDDPRPALQTTDRNGSIFGPILPQGRETEAFTQRELLQIRARRIEANMHQAAPGGWPEKRRFETIYPGLPGRVASGIRVIVS